MYVKKKQKNIPLVWKDLHSYRNINMTFFAHSVRNILFSKFILANSHGLLVSLRYKPKGVLAGPHSFRGVGQEVTSEIFECIPYMKQI